MGILDSWQYFQILCRLRLCPFQQTALGAIISDEIWLQTVLACGKPKPKCFKGSNTRIRENYPAAWAKRKWACMGRRGRYFITITWHAAKNHNVNDWSSPSSALRHIPLPRGGRLYFRFNSGATVAASVLGLVTDLVLVRRRLLRAVLRMCNVDGKFVTRHAFSAFDLASWKE